MTLRRARPLLGTIVDICVDDADDAIATRAITDAFAEVAHVHRLMSFHEFDSDLARLNRAAANAPIAVDARTREVIALALAFAEESDGVFDPTVARELVDWGVLPRPIGAPEPEQGADWRHVDVYGDGRIGFARPLWLDLGGIAKGYAVDRAVDALRAGGITTAIVNAGGDVSVLGARARVVHLRDPRAPTTVSAAVELADASVATSGAYFERDRSIGPHVHGRRRCAVGRHGSVSVVAARCAIADALTKVVLADADVGLALARAYGARACAHTRAGWRALDEPELEVIA